ncbi:HNH endonuclease [Riemerella columbina]|uniref:HNH endonuclease n=1 Tax=Riemerella columbina TaxID=103810 RepID=UPI000375223F|nr:HNH endonuclease signature motif containing protein [Riemerella columbina]
MLVDVFLWVMIVFVFISPILVLILAIRNSRIINKKKALLSKNNTLYNAINGLEEEVKTLQDIISKKDILLNQNTHEIDLLNKEIERNKNLVIDKGNEIINLKNVISKKEDLLNQNAKEKHTFIKDIELYKGLATDRDEEIKRLTNKDSENIKVKDKAISTTLTNEDVFFFNEYEFKKAKGELSYYNYSLESQILGRKGPKIISLIKNAVRYSIEKKQELTINHESWLDNLEYNEIKKRIDEESASGLVPEITESFISDLETLLYKYQMIYKKNQYGNIKMQVDLLREAREAEEKIKELQKIENRLNNKRDRISQKVKDAVWNRDGGRCVECGSSEKIEFDHIIPFSKGGSNTYRNIQLLCESCNRKKSNKIG